MVIFGLSTIITWITNPILFEVDYLSNYITLIMFIVGIIRFIGLLVTNKRYDKIYLLLFFLTNV
jgi:hypothetical protein